MNQDEARKLITELDVIIIAFVMQGLDLSREQMARGKEILEQLKSIGYELFAFKMEWVDARTPKPTTTTLDPDPGKKHWEN
ncbi:MAG: hypothetical protein KGJ89_02205 [Patescibacteria group bacterium]|nr:hypothetical protein [Patescibacteria group bacterium]MDE2015690.1 hypothetical protein [Patescibacteria group bacterium]MDE2226747.1 hypothetical protein [Patescibacteria group bacterium]